MCALDDIAAALSVAPMTPEEQRLLLDVARDVAHAGERRFAPLTAFLIGAAVAPAGDRHAALRRAVDAVRLELERTGSTSDSGSS